MLLLPKGQTGEDLELPKSNILSEIEENSAESTSNLYF